VEKSGGFLRIGLVHYNTAEEVEPSRLLAALMGVPHSSPWPIEGSRLFCETWDSPASSIWDLEKKPRRAPPWKSGASAPRNASRRAKDFRRTVQYPLGMKTAACATVEERRFSAASTRRDERKIFAAPCSTRWV
jgi:hypothetical protein